MKSRKLTMVFLLMLSGFWAANAQEPAMAIEPRHYVCYRTESQLIIDGLLREPGWQQAQWSEDFVDIEGSLKPLPRFSTRVKMLWDDQYLYIAAQLDEPHVWATLRQRDTVIFYDNDFEVFIDPDGDTHNYLEFEMNALNTQWDLLLLKPYRDEDSANVAIDHWNYNGLKSALYVDGTLNNPLDTDRGWTIEIALPLDALAEVSAHGKKPVDGEQYRINFSRVEWKTEIAGDKYRKLTQMVNGSQKPLPEDNWVWSPQGVVAMHQPETWGFVQFCKQKAGAAAVPFVPDPDNDIRKTLWMLYHWEAKHFLETGHFSNTLQHPDLNEKWPGGKVLLPEIQLTASGYEATLPSHDARYTWHITHDGRIWKD